MAISRARVTKFYNESLTQGASKARVTQFAVESLTQGASEARVTQFLVEILTSPEASYTRSVSHTLNLDDEIELSKTTARRELRRLILRQTVGLVKTHSQSVTSYLGLNQSIVKSLRIPETVAQTLTLTQTVLKDQSDEDVDSTLTLTQTISKSKIVTASVNHTLTLTQTILPQIFVNLHVNSTLVFLPTWEKNTGISYPGTQTVTVPTVIGVKVRRLVILQSDDETIVLPAAQFSDVERGDSRVNIKRSMSGERRTYKRETIASSLSYKFIIDRAKALELRQFILAANTKVLRMENWKGEYWTVVLTNNPFSFTEEGFWNGDRGNKCSITLEFTGVRTN